MSLSAGHYPDNGEIPATFNDFIELVRRCPSKAEQGGSSTDYVVDPIEAFSSSDLMKLINGTWMSAPYPSDGPTEVDSSVSSYLTGESFQASDALKESGIADSTLLQDDNGKVIPDGDLYMMSEDCLLSFEDDVSFSSELGSSVGTSQ